MYPPKSALPPPLLLLLPLLGRRREGGAEGGQHASHHATPVSIPLPLQGLARAVTTTFGVLYALAASELIVAHMAKEPLPLPWAPLVILALGWGNQQ